jgi:hypothetical protein
LKLNILEADQVEVVVLFVEYRQFDAQHFFIPPRAGDGKLVVSDYERAALGRRKVAEQDYGDLFHPELLRSQQSRVARDDVIVGTHKNRVCPPPLPHRSRDTGDLRAAVRSRVVRARNQAFDRPALDLDVDIYRGFDHFPLCHARLYESPRLPVKVL